MTGQVLEAGPVAAPVAGRSIRIGANRYPVVLPKVRDPRLHVAMVVITIHVLGQIGLGFHVSVPQIVAAILTTFILGVAIAFRSSKAFIWPASAMLTGSGVALILRVPDTPPDDHWTFHKWWVFAAIAAVSLATKHLIQYRGAHLFNPSNVGLVAAFLILGSQRVEPLDFWWAPFEGWMIVAYAVILVGGLLITRRLRLLSMAMTFWVTLALGVGLLAASGHCITARWAFGPVCDSEFWRVIVFSPEVLIFLFFMITDPKTVPAGRVGRVVFGFLVAVLGTLLMAPQTTEFATKVALLGALVIVCACRPLLDRVLPTPESDDDRIGRFALRLLNGRNGDGGWVGRLARVGVTVAVLVGVGAGVVAAGSPGRGVLVQDSEEILGRVPHDVNPDTFPEITVDQDVLDWNHEITGEGAQEIVLTLVENLYIEREALLRGDSELLTAVDHGDRLGQMLARLNDVESTGALRVERVDIDEVHMTLIVPFGSQSGLSLGLESRGTVTVETYDASGELIDTTTQPLATTFVMRRATGDRWLNVAEVPIDNGD